MLDLKLFFGFEITPEIQEELDNLNKKFVSIFINNNDEKYLQTTFYKDSKFLGKFLGPIVNLELLFDLEKNIYSITNKLVKDIDKESLNMKLITIHAESE